MNRRVKTWRAPPDLTQSWKKEPLNVNFSDSEFRRQKKSITVILRYSSTMSDSAESWENRKINVLFKWEKFVDLQVSPCAWCAAQSAAARAQRRTRPPPFFMLESARSRRTLLITPLRRRARTDLLALLTFDSANKGCDGRGACMRPLLHPRHHSAAQKAHGDVCWMPTRTDACAS